MLKKLIFSTISTFELYMHVMKVKSFTSIIFIKKLLFHYFNSKLTKKKLFFILEILKIFKRHRFIKLGFNKTSIF